MPLPAVPRRHAPVLATAALLLATVANSRPDPGDLCLRAAAEAADQFGLPQPVMQAITLTETGRGTGGGLRPWPWAVNLGGEGHWFATQHEAIAFVTAALAGGRSNIDIGCFQLNHRWHGAAFASVTDMFDPAQNAAYAAEFLRGLYAQQGNWTDAVGAYHSATPEHAERYLARFATVLAGLGSPDRQMTAAPSPRENSFPLLLAGAVGQGPSLVPLTAARPRLIGD